jgi:hypothetical protein
MRTSLLTFLGDSQGGSSPVDAYVRDLRAARDQGFDFAWTVQLPWEHDALITLAVALRGWTASESGPAFSRSSPAIPWPWLRKR